ncbi:serine/threonine-protein kinase [Sorangium sp. So ce854]|uniref:serine/threonine-protein kinase n=1 Tax=Sorangium sp. So ce854 TaxID=3133322 RepID=UPI003F5EE854
MSPRSTSAPAPSTGSTLRAEGVRRSSPSSAAFPRASAPELDEPESLGLSLLSPPLPSFAPPPDGGGATRRIYREGDVIGGKYRLRYVLGEGGMGMVWLARNDVLHIDVAIKFIRREVNSTEATVRLLQEARAAARIDHPSIVRVLDFGESDHHDPYIVMEVLRGEQLVEAIERRKRFSPEAALRILLPIASALAAAHDCKIVHRDLKPENIFLVKNDRGDITPKIVDFGIAKVWSETSGGDVTMAGTVLGSPDYMSPEQARGITDVDGQTDVWAFSVVLYETITGQRPFQGGNYHDLVAAILVKDAVPITELGVGDAALWRIIARGLGKERSNRWRTMREMGVALAWWATEHGVEEDVTGTSIAVHWLSDGEQRPLSERRAARAQKGSASGAGQDTPASEDVARWDAARKEPPRHDAAPPTGGRRRAALLALGAIAVLGAIALAASALRPAPPRAGGADAPPSAHPAATGEALPPAAAAAPPAAAAAPPPAAAEAPPPAAAAASPPATDRSAARSGAAAPERAVAPERAAAKQPDGPQPAAGQPRREPAGSGAAGAAEGEAAAPARPSGARRAATPRTSSKTPGAALPVPARPNF